MRDQAADRHACEDIELRKDRLENRAADILEIDVDALRAGVLELCGEIGITVIDAGIEAQLLDRVVAFFLPARDADRAQSFDLRDLSDHRADSA